MKNHIRPLTPPESAFTFSNDHWPLVAVILIRVEGQVEEALLSNVLALLQARHQLLRAKIIHSNNQYFFEALNKTKPIPCEIIPRPDDNSWEVEVEKALNTHFSKEGPLMRVIYLKGVENHGEFLLLIHHSIIDGIGARLILTDFLKLVGGQHLRVIKNVEKVHRYPLTYSGLKGIARKAVFMGTQMLGEISFALKSKKLPIPEGAENGILSFRLEENISQKIIEKAGKAGLSMNSLIAASMLHALYEHDKKKGVKWMRAIVFADMRAKMEPPVHAHALGCYISMARFPIKIQTGQNLEETTTDLWKGIYSAGKRGDMLMYAMLSFDVIKMTIKMEKFRMADIALSYIGNLELQEHYGALKVKDVKAFITNNHLGPVLTAFGLCLFGRIGICMNYLRAEFSPKQAKNLMLKTKKLLEEFA